ncbi:MAG: glucose-6-phosphate isomerase [Pelagibacterales bacterium MED-G44]|nr:MAG: glucose-6-phosphate isomerase [Pelagibacterales bacterium MED-G44]
MKFKNFNQKKSNSKVKKILNELVDDYSKKNNQLLLSLSKKYKYKFKFQNIKKYKKFKHYRIFGMGGSSLGAEAIYSFLSEKIRKSFSFINNIDLSLKQNNKNNQFNIIISKSGNTLETLTNLNYQKVKKNCLFITENRKSYLRTIALKLKSEIIEHNNFIGGRYSVLSETGMIPAFFMGLKPNNFKRLDNLISSNKFINTLTYNVSSILSFHQKKKNNSIILNYDESSNNLFYWYQQLVAESLGKSSKGILPIVSPVPKDNHSVMQLYLDGFKKNFFTFFYVMDKQPKKINNNTLLSSHKYLRNKKISDVLYSQFRATQNVFLKKKIPFRSFIIKKRDEKTLGELFAFFILETILLGKALKINPFDQPAVELIKTDTTKILKAI